MKKMIGNITWLVPFCLMVAVPSYPQLSGIAQALAWVFISLVILAIPLVICAIFAAEKKEDLEKMAKKKSWSANAFSWARTLAMFMAVAFAGFTVAAGFYLVLSIVARMIRPLAETRLDQIK